MPVRFSAMATLPQATCRPSDRTGRVALVAAALIIATLAGAQPAQAQLFGWLGGRTFETEATPSIPPGEVMRRLSSRGYQLNAGLQRNGGVYLADVTDARGRQQRLVIDAYRGRVVQAFDYGPPRPAGFVAEPRGFASAPAYPGSTYASREAPASAPAYRQAPALDPRAQDIPDREPRSTRASRARAAREAARENSRSAPSDQSTTAKIPALAPSEATTNPTQPREPARPAEPAKATAAATPSAAAPAAVAPAAPVAPAPRTPAAPASQDNKAGFANGVPINPLD